MLQVKVWESFDLFELKLNYLDYEASDCQPREPPPFELLELYELIQATQIEVWLDLIV